ncbi:hypothetical protein LINPERPRIM_LOCUS38189 [Linum perenne]
MERNTLLYKR